MSEGQVGRPVEQAVGNSAKMVVRLLPDLDNVFQELGQLKTLLDSDITIDIKVRKTILDVFQMIRALSWVTLFFSLWVLVYYLILLVMRILL